MKRIKLLAILPFFYPHSGGSQKYAEELYSRVIRENQQIEIDVLCYNTDGASSFEQYRGLSIYRVPCWNILPGQFVLPNPFNLLLILFKLSKNNYDFVNVHVRFFDPTWWGWLYAKLIGAKSIYTGHSGVRPLTANRLISAVALLVDSSLAKFAVKQYDIVTVANESSLQFLVNVFGLNPRSIHIVSVSVDKSLFHHIVKDNKSSYKIPNTGKVVCGDTILITYIGRITDVKGIKTLLRIIELWYERYGSEYPVKFVIGGEGALLGYVKKWVRLHNFQDNVFIAGSLEYKQVRFLLSITDIFVNFSNREGLPLLVLEACASRCGVIATDVGDVSSVIKDGKTGFLVPAKSPTLSVMRIHALVKKPELRKRFADNCHSLVDTDYNYKTSVGVFINLLVCGV